RRRPERGRLARPGLDRKRSDRERLSGSASRDPATRSHRPRRACRPGSRCCCMNVYATPDEFCAGDMMARTFVAAAPEDTLRELAERLAAADAGSALVLEYGRLTGILTSRDILPAVAGRVHPTQGRVREWMAAAPVPTPPAPPATSPQTPRPG